MFEAFLILGAIAIGVGYMQVMSFSGMLITGQPNYFEIPIITCLSNSFFGFMGISLILYSKRAIEIMSVTTNHQVGSFQEMAYYFTNDRGLIIIIGIMYSFQCMLRTSYCLYFVIKYFTLMVDKELYTDSREIRSTYVFNVTFIVTVIVYIATSR